MWQGSVPLLVTGDESFMYYLQPYGPLYRINRAAVPVAIGFAWSPAPSTSEESFLASPILGPDLQLYVASGNGVVYCIDGVGGRLRWSVNLPAGGTSTPGVLSGNGYLYLFSGTEAIVGINTRTASIAWTYTVTSEVMLPTSTLSIGFDGTLYAGLASGTLLALVSQNNQLVANNRDEQTYVSKACLNATMSAWSQVGGNQLHNRVSAFVGPKEAKAQLSVTLPREVQTGVTTSDPVHFGGVVFMTTTSTTGWSHVFGYNATTFAQRWSVRTSQFTVVVSTAVSSLGTFLVLGSSGVLVGYNTLTGAVKFTRTMRPMQAGAQLTVDSTNAYLVESGNVVNSIKLSSVGEGSLDWSYRASSEPLTAAQACQLSPPRQRTWSYTMSAAASTSASWLGSDGSTLLLITSDPAKKLIEVISIIGGVQQVNDVLGITAVSFPAYITVALGHESWLISHQGANYTYVHHASPDLFTTAQVADPTRSALHEHKWLYIPDSGVEGSGACVIPAPLTSATWADAVATCPAGSRPLTSAATSLSSANLLSSISQAYPNFTYWIGCSRDDSGWQWVDTTASSNLNCGSATCNLWTIPATGQSIPTTSISAFPPDKLTGSTTKLVSSYGDGTYVVSSSGYNEPDYWAFDRVSACAQETCFWTNAEPFVYDADNGGGYIGSTTTTVGDTQYAGDWLQIQMPAPVVLSSYALYTRSDILARGPKSFVIAGSNDGSTWVNLDLRTDVTNWSTSGFTFKLSRPAAPYFYFRIIVLANNGDPWLSLGEWTLYGQTGGSECTFAANKGLIRTPVATSGMIMLCEAPAPPGPRLSGVSPALAPDGSLYFLVRSIFKSVLCSLVNLICCDSHSAACAVLPFRGFLQSQSTLVQVNTVNGAPMWSASVLPSDFSTPAAPLLVSADGKQVIVFDVAGSVFAVSRIQGSLNWAFRGASSAVAGGGILDYSNSLYFATTNGMVYALNANSGEMYWSKRAPSAISRGGVVSSEGLLYFAGSRSDATKIFCMESLTGDFVWEYTLPAPAEVTSLTSPMLGPNGILYVGLGDRTLLSVWDGGFIAQPQIDATANASCPLMSCDDASWPMVNGNNRRTGVQDVGGPGPASRRVRWTSNVKGSTDADLGVVLGSPMVGRDNTIFRADTKGYVAALYPFTGVMKWFAEVRAPLSSPPVLSNDYLFTTTSTDAVVALNLTTGAVVWNTTNVATCGTMSPVAHSAKLYVPGTNGLLTALDQASGLVKWRFQVDPAFVAVGSLAADPVLSPPSITPDGSVLISVSGCLVVMVVVVFTGRCPHLPPALHVVMCEIVCMLSLSNCSLVAQCT